MEEQQNITLFDEIKNFEVPQLKSIADLNGVSVDMKIECEKSSQFPYKYLQIDNIRYKIPNSVIKQMKDILELNPKVRAFKVKKTGSGIKTTYTTIPIQ